MKFSCIRRVPFSSKLARKPTLKESFSKPTGDDDQVESLHDYQIVKKLNSGRYGCVVLARNCRHQRHYAIKLVQKRSLEELCGKSRIEQEAKALEACSTNSFVVDFYGIKQSRSCYALIQEYAPFGDLATILHYCGRFKEDDARFYIAEITLALQFIHDSGIVHRDIKLENIVLDSKGHAKIIDFGESVFLTSCDEVNQHAGTLEYMAPEIFQDVPYDYSVDLFSLGVCSYCLLTGCLPFDRESNMTSTISSKESLAKIQNAILYETPVFPKYLSLAARQLLMGLLWKTPRERLGCPYPEGQKHLRRHPFFQEVDWRSVAKRNSEVPQIIRQIMEKIS